MNRHDVYSYGVISSSTLYSVRGAFPASEGYAEIDDVRYVTGGEAANSSVVLAGLGVAVKLDGNWLGDDDGGKRTKALLDERQIDTTRLPLRQGYTGVREVVFAADGQRTIFGTYGDLLENADWNTPETSDIVQAKVVCLDPFFAQPAARVAVTAFDADIPVVTVDCRCDDPVLRHTAAVVIAESYLRENYAGHEPEAVFREYLAATRGLVVFTFGNAPIWYARPGDPVSYLESYPIDPVDTTGGGDSFRAGIVYGFLQGWQDARLIDFAAALAALNCTRFPGVMDSPSLGDVADFMEASGRRA